MKMSLFGSLRLPKFSLKYLLSQPSSVASHAQFSPYKGVASLVSVVPMISNLLTGINAPEPQKVLSVHEISLENRYPNEVVNQVFKDNILLNVAYLGGKVRSADEINWNEVTKPFEYTMRLNPNETFAYHEDVLEQYKGKINVTTKAHFNASEGFKSDGYLVGDGVCHLASLLYWVAKDAGLSAYAPTNHDFANIPQVPQEYGVAIYSQKGESVSAYQNLYISNNRKTTVELKFEYKNNILKVTVVELESVS